MRNRYNINLKEAFGVNKKELIQKVAELEVYLK